MHEEMDVNDGSQLQVFDIIALPIFALLIATAFVTFLYPSNQPDLYFWGGQTLLSGEILPLSLILLIIIPTLFITTYFFPAKRTTWRQICYMYLGIIVLIAPLIWIGAVIDNFFSSFGNIFSSGFCGAMSYGFTISSGYVGDHVYNTCMEGPNSKVTIKLGVALPMFYFAAFLSFFAFVVKFFTRVVD